MNKELITISLVLSIAISTIVFIAYAKFNLNYYKKHILTLIPIFIGSVAAISVTLTISLDKPSTKFDKIDIISSQQHIEYQQDLDEVISRINALSNELKKPINLENDDKNNALRKIETRVTVVESGIEKIQEIIATDAERLVTVPILLREIDTLRSDIKTLKDQQLIVGESLKEDVTEAKAQARWILGTLGIGLLALVVPVVRSTINKN